MPTPHCKGTGEKSNIAPSLKKLSENGKWSKLQLEKFRKGDVHCPTNKTI